MNNHELEKYKLALDKKAQELQRELDTTPDIINFEDRASIEGETDEAVSQNEQVGIKDSIRSRLEDINMALERMNNGTYGICIDCGKEIETAILDIDPESRYCREYKLRQLN